MQQVFQELEDLEQRNEQSSEKRKRSQNSPPQQARKKKDDVDIGLLCEFLSKASEKMRSVDCERDHLDMSDCDVMFLLCLKDNLKALSPQKKSLAKIKIQQVLFQQAYTEN